MAPSPKVSRRDHGDNQEPITTPHTASLQITRLPIPTTVMSNYISAYANLYNRLSGLCSTERNSQNEAAVLDPATDLFDIEEWEIIERDIPSAAQMPQRARWMPLLANVKAQALRLFVPRQYGQASIDRRN